ncbi:hypothetical protein NM208_g762 [Fusarium decemcellulare]|uniref:Uncharacterized protein n=1 Tax=Fusarium decemcellulare TaxID=57161 RepID=A0ACC1SY90_9HYPO|nr:hypothetical protein NM208_g762 [Fusarium decemcellulare]
MDEKLDILTAFVQQNEGQARSFGIQAVQDALAPASSPSTSHIAAFSPINFGAGNPYAAPTPFLDTGRIREELSLSQRHSTAPQHLMTWPCSPLQLSEPELQYPMDLEIKRPKMSQSTAPPRCLEVLPGDNTWLSRLSLSHVHLLTKLYFEYFHPSCLILDETKFYSDILSKALQTNFAKNYNTCTVLLVCALGSIVAYYSGHEDWCSNVEHDVGTGFFNLANAMFRDLEGANWSSVECLLLMGVFYSSKIRVYDAWQVNHRACCTILILVPLQGTLEAQDCQLFWIAYLHESQILAEFDFPASGLGKLASSIPLPLVPGAGTDPRHAKYQFFFLALISMRKLLNRILFHLYSREQNSENANHDSPSTERSTVFLSATPSVIYELDRQLEEWRMCLPPGLEFSPYSGAHEVGEQGFYRIRSTDERLRGNLMTRYFAAKSIIHRPFIYRTLHCDHDATLSETDRVGAQTAVGLFALEVQIALLLRRDTSHFALPQDWKMAGKAREIIKRLVTEMSPTISRDGEILQLLS